MRVKRLEASLMLFGMARCGRAFSTIRRVHPTWRLYSTADPSASEKTTSRVLFLGTPDVAATSLRNIFKDSIKDSNYEVVGVVTQPPKRRKRKGKEIPSPVGFAAEELGIPVLCPEKVSSFGVSSVKLLPIAHW